MQTEPRLIIFLNKLIISGIIIVLETKLNKYITNFNKGKFAESFQAVTRSNKMYLETIQVRCLLIMPF
jgi:hypothetical protein